MPKRSDRYTCPDCGSRQNSPERLKRHKRAFCRGGQTTTDGVDEGTHDTTGTHEGDTRCVPGQIVNPITELTPLQDAGTHRVSLSSPVLSKGEGDTRGTHGVSPIELPGPGGSMIDPRDRERKAVAFLSAHKGYLKPDFELSFYLSMKYKVLGNGEAPRPLTERERDILFELEYVVRGLVAEDEAQREADRRAAHDPKDGHPKEGCRYCEQAAEDQRRADQAFEEDLAMYARLAAERATRPVEARSVTPRLGTPAPYQKAVLRPKAARTEGKNG